MKKKSEAKSRKKKPEVVFTVGKRKAAVARAVCRPGTGKIFVNNKALDVLQPEAVRLFLREPLQLAGDVAKTLDINVNVKGGGMFGQAEAVRQAIAKAIVAFEPSLKNSFLEYDRALLVADPRRNEPHKPSRSSAGPRRHKQRSKR
ncbi:MAG: 30S ribosomal protein S9 [Candidatus Aenigmatarchaeota archaeon]|nr:30S ribosomal protein S9 [Candidatus Aenigmarchaeota archaeon]